MVYFGKSFVSSTHGLKLFDKFGGHSGLQWSGLGCESCDRSRLHSFAVLVGVGRQKSKPYGVRGGAFAGPRHVLEALVIVEPGLVPQPRTP